MRARAEFFLEGLLSLDRYERADRRAVFRQSVASIALAAPGQSPLEGCDEQALARSVRVALADGLFDDLGWLAAPAAGVALFEIAGALPLGAARRELGRIVLSELYEGDAATFVAIATRMATGGSARALAGAGIRARVALALGLSASSDVPVDALALALVSRRELAAAWLGTNSIGALPQRRLAARLIERAAREAEGRARRGDDEPAMLFHPVVRREGDAGRPSPESIEGAWRTLLADRETLVWRHVAVARGLLSIAVPALGDEIRSALATRLSPTEWRRGATSLAASIAVDPDRGLRAAIDLLSSPLLERDPGIAAALLWGLPRAADAEPEAAAALLDALSRAAPLFIAEDLIEIRAELGPLAATAADRCAAALAAAFEQSAPGDDVVVLSKRLRLHLVEDRPRGSAGDGSRPDLELRAALENAVDAFVTAGSRDAHARALVAVDRAADAVGLLESLAVDATGSPASARGNHAAVVLVREIDSLLLESGVLKSLLLLSRGPGDPGGGALPLDDVDERLASFLLASESVPFAGDGNAPGVMGHQRKLRALLHLIDGETTEFEDDQDRRDRVQDRWTSACRTLLTRLAAERATPLRRAVAATVARALDALVRDGAADPADALLYAAFRTGGPEDLTVLAEASMNPEVWRLLRGYAAFIDAELGRPFDAADTSPRIPSLEGLIAALPATGTQRIEALRSALTRLAKALGAVQTADALRPLADPETSPLRTLAEALERLGQLTASALRRCGGEDEPIAALPASPYPLTAALGRALEAGADVAASLQPVLSTSLERAFASAPRALAGLVARILPRIAKLPADLDRPSVIPLTKLVEGPLPAWMPARRTLGGFYVHRQIGGGAAGTVFIVTRAEERHDPAADRFALKVPDYDATAARSLSESDFLKLFREEAGALLAIPEHENLARFVTFDAGARPKPILVMELVEGTRCDKAIASRLLTLPSAFTLLDGVLAGLGAMHGVGVGHLDIKPSNVILRNQGQAVLVDFGLAGRHLRPGCGTSSYGAPEVWGIVPEGVTATPLSADVYSFGCVAFEVLTGQTLFDAPNEVALISQHLTHDGLPAGVKKLADRGITAGLASVLRRCLRRDPRQRGTVVEIREELRAVAAALGGKSWPVPV
ncbi:MAG: serine/threonine-protein kinase [Minicystis sp.]